MSASREPNRWLKLKTKALIKACGGLKEASLACKEERRPYSVAQLGRCQNVRAPDYLPIDIVMCLEEYCGQTIVTQAMADRRPTEVAAGCLRDEVCDFIERGGDLSRAVRKALIDEQISAQEGAEIRALIEQGREDLDQAEVALDAAMAPRSVPQRRAAG